MAVSDSEVIHKLSIGGDDTKFGLDGFRFEERINEGFTIDVRAIGDGAQIDIKSLIGTMLEIKLDKNLFGDESGSAPKLMSVAAEPRTLTGVIAEASVGAEAGKWRKGDDDDPTGVPYFYHFKAVGFLDQADHQRVDRTFSDLKVSDIVTQLASPFVTGGCGLDIAATSKAYDHILQYNETDLAVIKRLLRKSGQSFFYRHEAGGHKFVTKSSFSGSGMEAEVGKGADSLLTDVSTSFKTQTKTFRTKSWNPETNSSHPDAESETDQSWAKQTGGSRVEEIFDSGYYEETGSKLAKAVQKSREAQANKLTAKLNYPVLGVGDLIEPKGDLPEGMEPPYLITACSFSIDNDDPLETNGRIEMNSASIGAPPEMTDQRPSMPQFVTGKVTDTCDNDPEKMGRVKVQYSFSMDLESFWVPVVRSWAGPDFGTWFAPRIGHEVVLAFLNSDPDRPVVLGSLSGAVNELSLPDEHEKLVSFIRTMSDNGANEVLFRDEGGNETIRTTGIRNVETISEKATSQLAKTQMSISVADKVKTEPSDKPGDPKNLYVYADEDIFFEAKKNIEIKAGDSITIVVGKSKVVMKKDGTIDITGKDATVKTSGDFEVKSSKDVKMKASMNFNAETSGNMKVKSGVKLDINAGAIATLKGALVKIN